MAKGVVVLGVPIDNVSMDEALRRIDDFVLDGSFHQIATANVDFLVNAVSNQEYKEILWNCDLVLADGMPIVWASRLLHSPLSERVTGADLVPRLAHLSRQRRYGILLLGATPKVCEVAAARLQEMGARIVGQLTPPLCALDKFDNDYILAEIEKANPDILLVALGSPKQEKWIYQNRHRLKVPVCIGVGGSLDFLAGAVPRAPRWMQRAGLEWLYRLKAEPRRLAPRYLKDAFGMARYFSVQLARSLGTRRRGKALQIRIESIGSVNILCVSGMMTGPQLEQFELAGFSLASKGGALVLELAGVSYLGADGIRALAGLGRIASSYNCQLWVARMPTEFVQTLKASFCDEVFHIVPPVFDVVRQTSWERLEVSFKPGEGWSARQLNRDFPPDASAARGRIYSRFASNESVDFDCSCRIEPTRAGSRPAVGEGARQPVRKAAV